MSGAALPYSAHGVRDRMPRRQIMNRSQKDAGYKQRCCLSFAVTLTVMGVARDRPHPVHDAGEPRGAGSEQCSAGGRMIMSDGAGAGADELAAAAADDMQAWVDEDADDLVRLLDDRAL